MSDLERKAKQLSEKTGMDVSANPYDIGYWSRIAGLRAPSDSEQLKGWKDADKELRAEAGS